MIDRHTMENVYFNQGDYIKPDQVNIIIHCLQSYQNEEDNKMRMKKLLVTMAATIMLFTMPAMSVTATETDADNADAKAAVSTEAADTAEEETAALTEAADTEAEVTVAPTEAPDPYLGVGSYMGFFQIQTSSWVYRNDFNEKNYAAPEFNYVYTATDPHATTTEIKDTVIDGDGDYTVSLNNISLEGSTNFNMVALSTNIAIDSPIKITAASLYYNDRLISDNPIQKDDNKVLRQLMFINEYDSAMKETLNTMVPQDGTNMVIKFTVEGFGYPKTVEEEAAASDVEDTAAADTAETDKADAADTASTAAEDDNGGLPTGAIIGIIAGVVVLAIIIVLVIKSKKNK